MKIRFGIGPGADTGPDQLAAIVDHQLHRQLDDCLAA
jgi:hypothetical protein